MDLDLIYIYSHPRGTMALLVLVGVVGHIFVHRWPRSFVPVIALAFATSAVLAARVLALLATDAGLTIDPFALSELALATGAVLIGLGLPF